MAYYTHEFKDAVVHDVLSGECKDATEAAAKHGVSVMSVKRWLKKATQSAATANTTTAASTKTVKAPLPKGWTLIKGIQAVGARKALGKDSVAYGEYCRREGVLNAQIEALETWLEGRDVVDAEKLRTATQALHEEKQKTKQLDYQLSRREKALAETATLLALTKKASAVWGAPQS